jgi:ribonuclease HI
MKFLICNILLTGDSIAESHLDLNILKEVAFNSKVASKTPDGKKTINYNYVLIPVLDKQLEKIKLDHGLLNIITSKIDYNIKELPGYSESIYSLFKVTSSIDMSKLDIDINVLAVIDDTIIDIFYTDGSFKKDTNEASYAVYRLLEESDMGQYSEITDKKHHSKSYSGKIKDSTNNVGELTGIKAITTMLGDKQYQLIVSDSEYSIKVFREWYYNWRNNDFKTYAKKTIVNKDLIVEISNNISASDKIVLFKWVRGHADTVFNEMCDALAKEVLK